MWWAQWLHLGGWGSWGGSVFSGEAGMRVPCTRVPGMRVLMGGSLTQGFLTQGTPAQVSPTHGSSCLSRGAVPC